MHVCKRPSGAGIRTSFTGSSKTLYAGIQHSAATTIQYSASSSATFRLSAATATAVANSGACFAGLEVMVIDENKSS
jgi:hypothetical protein